MLNFLSKKKDLHFFSEGTPIRRVKNFLVLFSKKVRNLLTFERDESSEIAWTTTKSNFYVFYVIYVKVLFIEKYVIYAIS